MTIEKIIKNLIEMEVTNDFINDIIASFEDYEYMGETEIIVSKDEYNSNIDYQAYANHKDAPIICIKIENNKIVDAWEA